MARIQLLEQLQMMLRAQAAARTIASPSGAQRVT
jgi:hypothetical protein